MRKLKEHIKHYLNVRSWEQDINRKARVIAKEYGYKKNSYEYQLILRNLSNNE